MGLLFLTAALTTGLILVIGCPHPRNDIDLEDKRERSICTEKECVAISESLLSNLDEAAEPCDDFYKFACGRYATKNPIPEDKTDVSAISIIKDLVQSQLKEVLEEPIDEAEAPHFQKLKKYYSLCVDLESVNAKGLAPMKELIDGVGGWPVVENKDPENDWQTVLFGLRAEKIDASYFFKMYVDTDYKNSSVRVISNGPPTYKLKQETLVKGKDDKNVKFYFKYMLDTAILFGAQEKVAEEDMAAVLDFEISLAKASKSLTEQRLDFNALYNIYTVAKLEEEFPKFPWVNYLDAFTPKNLTITKELKLLLTEPEYTQKLIKLLEVTPNRVVINYIIWRSTLDLMQYLNTDARKLEQNFISSVLGQSKRLDRYKECLDNIQEVMLPVISSLYVKKYFDQHSKDVASELVKYLKSEFMTILNETDWSEEDKMKAIEKVEVLNEFTGFPNELLDDDKLDSVFGSAQIVEDNFLKSFLYLDNFNTDFLYNRLYLPVNKTDWIDYANSAIVNAYYLPTTNSIIFPAAILQGSYFNAKRPKYVNFAAIGSVIGHEMSHGFDEIGHQFDKNGDLKNWWSKTAEKNFNEKKKCIVEQYDKYEIFDGTKLKGNLTVGENLADYGGQKMAYLSYQSWLNSNEEEQGLPGLNYTNQQLFWIAGASIWCNNERPESVKFKAITDAHPPNEFRVNGPLKNFEMFSKDFGCPLGSKMNPVDKCKPW